MEIITRKHASLAVATFAGVIVSFGGLNFVMNNNSEAATTAAQAEKSAVYLSTSTIPVRVSGMVKAAKSTVVYAETAGVVTSLPVREGAKVEAGEVLAIQAMPVVDARLALAEAERGLSGLEHSLNTEMRDGQVVQAAYRAYSASEIASLRAVGNDSRIQEGSDALITSLQQSILAITSSANYVNNNRSIFTTEGLRVYDEVVRELYGRVPNYFQGGVVTAGVKATDLQAMLKEASVINDPATLRTLSLLVNGQLTALTKLFTTGEADVFDRGSAFATESNQAEYLTERSAVLSAAQALQTTSAAFAQAVDGVLEDGVAQQTSVNVTDIDRELALTQAFYAEAIAAQASAVAQAGVGVVAAELSLGRPKAAFSGTISRVFVDEGQYVMPGTPLLTLIGEGAREIEVTVPAYLLSGVKVGQVFKVEGKTIGFVDRFSTVGEGGSGTVIVALSGEGLPAVGTSLIGDIAIEIIDDVYVVPRSHIHFDADGAYLVYEDETVSRVEVVYDTGREFHVEVSEVKSLPLQAAVSISL
jgi:multidrug resistance efflux pump